MSSIVITGFKKFHFPQGSLKNGVLHFSDRFYFITFPNVNWFLVTIAYFNGLRKSFQILYRKLKPFRIDWEIEKNIFTQFWFWELLSPSVADHVITRKHSRGAKQSPLHAPRGKHSSYQQNAAKWPDLLSRPCTITLCDPILPSL